jgi:hypothetical protein
LLQRQKYNSLCDANEGVNDMVNKLCIDFDDEMDLEIEGETERRIKQSHKVREGVRVKQMVRVLLGGKK